MKECKVVSIAESRGFGLGELKLNNVNSTITEWLSQGWQVLNVLPYDGGSKDIFLITFYR